MPWAGNVRELRNFVESVIALTSSPTISMEDIPAHLLRELTGPATLPVRTGINPEQFERELLYHSILDLKRDIAEIKQLILEKDVISIPPDRRELEVKPVFQTGETLEELEREAIVDTLEQTRGNRRRAAKLLGIGERTLYRKLKLYEIDN